MLYKIFGCGISVPLIGFGANIGRGVFEAVNEQGFFGIFSGGISAAAEGLTLSLFLGLVFSLTSKAKSRRM
jgi:stage V sporulation protein AE